MMLIGLVTICIGIPLLIIVVGVVLLLLGKSIMVNVFCGG